MIHFEAQALGALDWASMAAQLQKLDVRSVFFYPNNLREHEATEGQLIGYRNAIRALSAAGITPHAFHGGYFAILLSLRVAWAALATVSGTANGATAVTTREALLS